MKAVNHNLPCSHTKTKLVPCGVAVKFAYYNVTCSECNNIVEHAAIRPRPIS